MNTPPLLVIQRIRAEYLEMPGLALKPEQVQRLCGVDRAVCDSALKTLVANGFLSVRADGAYRRERGSDLSRAKPAKAALDRRTAARRLRAHAS